MTVYDYVTIDTVEDVHGEYLKITGYANKYKIDDKTIIDDYGTTIAPMSFDIERYKKNPLIASGHDITTPVGRATVIEVREDGLYIEAEIYKASDEKTYYNILNKVYGAFSVGFITKDEYWSDILNAYVITDAELVEISVLGFPSNQESLIEHVSICELGKCTVVRSADKNKLNRTSTVPIDSFVIDKIVRKLLKNK